MRITNNKELEMVNKAVDRLTGSAVLVDGRSGKEYDLHNEAERRAGLARLINDYAGNMEFYVSKREDQGVLFDLIRSLDRENKDLHKQAS